MAFVHSPFRKLSSLLCLGKRTHGVSKFSFHTYRSSACILRRRVQHYSTEKQEEQGEKITSNTHYGDISQMSTIKKSLLLETPCRRIDATFRSNPVESVLSMIGLEILSIYGTHSMLVLIGMEFSTEFAVAFVINRSLRRLRFPIECIGAFVLTKFLPALKIPKLFSLFRREPSGKILRTLNEYGIAYLISARFCGVISVWLLYLAITRGLDLQPILDYFCERIQQSDSEAITSVQNWWSNYNLSTVLGTWAAAVSLSSIIYPGTIFIIPYVARILASFRFK
jgi:hypothetical protein